ncbi:MAG: hypothetical protein VB138_10285 [Burkholderia sp.]
MSEQPSIVMRSVRLWPALAIDQQFATESARQHVEQKRRPGRMAFHLEADRLMGRQRRFADSLEIGVCVIGQVFERAGGTDAALRIGQRDLGRSLPGSIHEFFEQQFYTGIL